MAISDIAAVSGLVIALAFAAWAAWHALSERVRCSEREIVKRHGWRKESMALPDIAHIKFHYHAVVGFVSCWEFVSRSGSSLLIDGAAHGITAALHALEKNLPGFSLAAFQRQFKEGDVEDTLEVWRAAPG